MMRITDRQAFLVIGLLCLIAMVIVLYLQFGRGLAPCSLCVFQRVGVLATLILAVIGLIVGFKSVWRYLLYLLIFIAEIFGLLAALRQVWIEFLPPDQVTACGPGLNFMLKALPLSQVIVAVFKGSGNCAKVPLRVIGLSIPEWSLIFFVILVISTLYALFRGAKRK